LHQSLFPSLDRHFFPSSSLLMRWEEVE
jgi:hypothetical protein